MRIINKRKKANYLNFKVNGTSQKVLIPANSIVEVALIQNMSQITNFGDFQRGFFAIIEDTKPAEAVKISKKTKVEDTLEKVEKEVKNYTDNKE